MAGCSREPGTEISGFQAHLHVALSGKAGTLEFRSTGYRWSPYLSVTVHSDVVENGKAIAAINCRFEPVVTVSTPNDLPGPERRRLTSAFRHALREMVRWR